MDAGVALTKLCGGLMLAAGIIIAVSCGLCTGYFGVVATVLLFDSKSRIASLFISPFLVAGLAGTAVGVGLTWGGLAVLRASPVARQGRPADRDE